MEIGGRQVLICDCAGTMSLDGDRVARACGSTAPATVHTTLCRAQIGLFERGLAGDAPLLVGCTQEAPLFSAIAEGVESAPPVSFVNIRERAGWGEEGGQAEPKIAALLAEAAVDVSPTPAVAVESAGAAIVYGTDEQAIEIAGRLAERLDVAVLLNTDDDVMPPRVARAPIHRGRIVQARGALGTFELLASGYAAAEPWSRRTLAFGPPADQQAITCDILIDLSGEPPLLTGGAKRDGYLRCDPGDPVAIERALFDASDLVGSFDKPRYVAYQSSICAHGRSRKTGCTHCLDSCPTGAITSAGDTVEIDALICAGCGQCASGCPTGAVRYDMPPDGALFERLRMLLTTFHAAGGSSPIVLIHDAKSDDLLAAIGRYGRGLPARLLPFPVHVTTQVGLDFLSAAMAYGAERTLVLLDRSRAQDRDTLDTQISMANAIAVGLGYEADRFGLIEESDPDRLEHMLFDHCATRDTPPLTAGSFLAMGGKRDRMRQALDHLHAHAPTPADRVDLAAFGQDAPYGSVEVDSTGCTLCLACVGACPPGALGDNPDRPQLTFREESCVQCGLCRTTCPENVITLRPQIDFTAQARERRILHEEAPAECVRCGAVFGVQSSVERMVEKLRAHSAFAASPEALDRIRMCPDCRVAVQFETKAPMAGRPRPRVRTTDDYLNKDEPE